MLTRFQVSGVRCQGSAPPPAKKTAGQIEKETLKKRIMNVECRSNEFCLSRAFGRTVYFKKD
jgi:hypothetical protein